MAEGFITRKGGGGGAAETPVNITENASYTSFDITLENPNGFEIIQSLDLTQFSDNGLSKLLPSGSSDYSFTSQPSNTTIPYYYNVLGADGSVKIGEGQVTTLEEPSNLTMGFVYGKTFPNGYTTSNQIIETYNTGPQNDDKYVILVTGGFFTMGAIELNNQTMIRNTFDGGAIYYLPYSGTSASFQIQASSPFSDVEAIAIAIYYVISPSGLSFDSATSSSSGDTTPNRAMLVSAFDSNGNPNDIGISITDMTSSPDYRSSDLSSSDYAAFYGGFTPTTPKSYNITNASASLGVVFLKPYE